MLETFYNFIESMLGVDQQTANKLVASFVILLTLWLIRLIAFRLISRRFTDQPRAFYNARRTVDYIMVLAGVFLVGRLWLDGIQSLATYLGLLSAGLVIALQDLLINLSGYVFITWRQPFVVGDRLQIGEVKGDVVDIRMFSFDLIEIGGRVGAEQSTGRIIHVPNGTVFKEDIANYNQGLPYIWDEIPFVVTFESDWRKAKQLLEAIVTRHAPDVREGVEKYNRSVHKRYVIAYRMLTPIVYTQIVDNGVELTMRFMLEPRKRRGIEQVIYEDVLDAFGPHWDIDFAYPTHREYIHYHERKEPPTQEAPTVQGRRLRPEDEDFENRKKG